MTSHIRAARDAAAKQKQHDQLVRFLNAEVWPRIVISLAKERNQDHLLPPEHDIVMTGKEIRAKYSRPCLEILELVFMRWVRGGRNLKGETFKTRWKLNPEAAVILAEWVLAQGDRQYTARECLAHLRQANLERLYGFRKIEDGQYLPREPVNAEEREALLAQGQRSVRRAWAQGKLNLSEKRTPDESEQINALRH